VAVDDLAAQFGVDQSTVHKHARQHGLPRRSPRLGPNQTDEAVRLYCPVTLWPNCAITSESPLTRWRLPCAELGSPCDHGGGGPSRCPLVPVEGPGSLIIESEKPSHALSTETGVSYHTSVGWQRSSTGRS
jgi:hypothetical protein